MIKARLNTAARRMVLGTVSALALLPYGAQGEAPLQDHPIRLVQFETANTLPKGVLELHVGAMQSDPRLSSATGNQGYFGGGSYAVSDRLSFGIDFSSYRDPTVNPINGVFPEFFLHDLAVWAKYGLIDQGAFKVSALASVEQFVRFDASLWGGVQSGVTAGALKIPISYSPSERVQLHLTPAVSVFPETVGGAAFYGVIASVGAGASFKATERLGFYGAVDVPVSGGNTISNTGAFVQQPVWTVGGRFNVTPKIALDAFVTNGVGLTPATSIWTHWPDGEPLLVGVQLSFTPGARYPDSFRGPAAPVSPRQASLQQDGFTIETADTLEPGVMALRGWYGSNENYGAGLSFGIDRDFQADFLLEHFANDGSVAPALTPTTELRYMIGPKLRLLDQNNGDPFSLAARVLFGRQIESNVGGVGVFYASLQADYQLNERVTLRANPQVAAFGNTEVAGLGFGVNFELMDRFELIAEATAVGLDATDPTWAAGARYNLRNPGLSVDLHASNAIGRNGIGTMIAQDNTKFSVQLTKSFDIPFWR
ncbi:MAG: hypothetical protein GY717_03275 [Rhodobacteraceae bacterium]|nr:hypothetical protein [Paracoccaceae bacterium]